ncbi:hypothetical protein GX411_08390 [Candidatus Fermentibacteria bacterium]|nr:hypothetical protein [Candidatus Fermentibacteria bacterium]
MTRRRQLLTAAVLLGTALAVSQIAFYNWRIVLALEMRELEEIRTSLQREVRQLENRRAELTAPARLAEIGSALGLAPLPLDRMALCCGSAEGRSGDVATLP